MPRYRLTIAYDGTDFHGWQKQEPLDPAAATDDMAPPPQPHADPTLVAAPGRVALRTVQAVVERAVREVVREPVSVMGASRTDAGVHARGQVAAFTCGPGEEQESAVGSQESEVAGQKSEVGTQHAARSTQHSILSPSHPITPSPLHSGWPFSRGTDILVRAVNSRLPDDVLILHAAPAATDFDPVIGAAAKCYSYTLHVSRVRPLWDRNFVQQVWVPLDVERMRDGAARLVGEHDFVGFAAAGHGRATTVRTIFSCDVEDAGEVEGGRRVRIVVSGSGFLYNMVRIIAGTLVEVGRGKLPPAAVDQALASRDRRLAGPTLPATGLCLEWIKYGP